MLLAQAVVDAERPGFQVGEGAIGPRQDDVSGHRADDVRIVAMSDAPAAGGKIVEPQPAGSAVCHLDGTQRQHLALGTASMPACRRIVLAAQGDRRFVGLH